MNPCDALPEDWGMYYDGVWMQHNRFGVGQIQVSGSDLLMRKQDGKLESVDAADLRCWWPRAGAFNTGNNAIYVARRAVRNMRKSAMSGDHYFVTWGSPYGKDIMAVLRDGSNAVPVEEGIKLIVTGKMQSVAVTRDIIFTQCETHPDRVSVVFKGIEAGTFEPSDGYTPMFSGHPLTPRILRQLEDAL